MPLERLGFPLMGMIRQLDGHSSLFLHFYSLLTLQKLQRGHTDLSERFFSLALVKEWYFLSLALVAVILLYSRFYWSNFSQIHLYSNEKDWQIRGSFPPIWPILFQQCLFWFWKAILTLFVIFNIFIPYFYSVSPVKHGRLVFLSKQCWICLMNMIYYCIFLVVSDTMWQKGLNCSEKNIFQMRMKHSIPLKQETELDDSGH